MDIGSILIAVIAATPGTIMAIRSWKNPDKLEKIHLDINSRMTELVKASKAESRAEGVAEERGRTDVPQDVTVVNTKSSPVPTVPVKP